MMAVESRDWFVKLWNGELLPYLEQCAREGLQMYGRRSSWEDPLEFLTQTWPWNDGLPADHYLSKLNLENMHDDDDVTNKAFVADADMDPLIMLMKLKEQAKIQRQLEIESMSYKPSNNSTA
uniref:CortBP2/NAV1-like AAA+ ATPase lid domain-containing protein n=1 Tax=Romanomermis culicivorax TaxID=13658 RepID=A0A915KDH3_ROMCU